MTDDLRPLLAERIDTIPVVPGDLERARAAGRRIRRRRRAAVSGGVAAVAVAVVAAGAVVAGLDDGPPERGGRDRTDYAALGPLDFGDGARAYADPGVEVHLGGRTFPADDLEYLDTDAVATPYGIVFYDAGRPMLLDPGGDVAPLVRGPLDRARDFHPTAKADATAPLVAWGVVRDGRVTITVRDMSTGDDVGSVQPDCGRCAGLVIDGIDGGVVFVRDRSGTRTWDSATGEWAELAGPGTRVADVRNGVVLYDGERPTAAGRWRLVPGAVDAQLSFDGEHVLYWSSTLQPTSPGGEPVVLEQGPRRVGDGFGWWTFDTDGSVLVATGEDYGDFTVHDCVLPTGSCTTLGPLRPTGGDPMFIGDDM